MPWGVAWWVVYSSAKLLKFALEGVGYIFVRPQTPGGFVAAAYHVIIVGGYQLRKIGSFASVCYLSTLIRGRYFTISSSSVFHAFGHRIYLMMLLFVGRFLHVDGYVADLFGQRRVLIFRCTGANRTGLFRYTLFVPFHRFFVNGFCHNFFFKDYCVALEGSSEYVGSGVLIVVSVNLFA